MFPNVLTEFPINQVRRLQNKTCVYCGTPIDLATRTQEHVIGRRFVPKGKLNGYWNLIVWSCRPCNQAKADLEDDLSAITMQPDIDEHGCDASLVEEAKRKARGSFSRRTKKLVHDSHEQIIIKAPFFRVGEIAFNLLAPPQVSEDRLMALAEYQIRAFFYFLTFSSKSQTGYVWKGCFRPAMHASRADWGNPIHMAFMNAVQGWEPSLLGITAGGFFKVVIRDHPSKPRHCAWALEWNQKHRIVGFFGPEDFVNTMFAALPSLQAITIQKTPRTYLQYRVETPLNDGDDKLFQWPMGAVPTPM